MKMRMKLAKLKINVVKAEEFNECNTLSQAKDDEFDVKHANSPQWLKLISNFQNSDYTIKPAWNTLDEILISKPKHEIIWVKDNLFISDEKSAYDEELLNAHKITHLINLVAKENSKWVEGKIYFTASLRDNMDCNILDTWQAVIGFVELHESLNPNSKFLIYCKKGVSRSAAILAAILIQKYKMNLDKALKEIKSKKANIDPNIGFIGQLQTFEEQVLGNESDNTTDDASSSENKDIFIDEKDFEDSYHSESLLSH